MTKIYDAIVIGGEPNHPDIEALGPLDDPQGAARQERAELIESLLARGFDVGQIRNAKPEERDRYCRRSGRGRPSLASLLAPVQFVEDPICPVGVPPGGTQQVLKGGAGEEAPVVVGPVGGIADLLVAF
jgi:hypothetical protein